MALSLGKVLQTSVGSLLSVGLYNNNGAYGYVSNIARKSMGWALSSMKDGQVIYITKNTQIVERAIKQAASQAAYGLLRSAPRYVRYLEQQQYNKTISELNNTGRGFNSQYQLLIDGQIATNNLVKNDNVTGTVRVPDYLDLWTTDSSVKNHFIDLQAMANVSSKNNVVLTQVQGRKHTRKEFISGGDYNISITGKIVSKYPDVFPESELSIFLTLMQQKILSCKHTMLDAYKIDRLIVIDYSTSPVQGFRNMIEYSISCVAVEPAEEISVIYAEAEKVNNVLEVNNKWLQILQFASNTIGLESLLKFI